MTTADVYRALWRHKYFIVVLTAVLVVAAWFLTSRQTRQYESSTLIRIQGQVVEQSEAFGSLVLGERLAQTYANVVTTGSFYDRVYGNVSERLGISPRLVLEAEPVRDLELLWITARSPSPKFATEVANAAPGALRDFIRETGTLRDQIVTVDPARVPVEPVSPNVKLNLAIALLLGLILNGALALLIERFSDRLPDPDELEVAAGRPILATIPVLSFSRSEAIPSPDVGERLLEATRTPGPAPHRQEEHTGIGRSAVG
jgi:capsular polysaccharide biosynthesis protein